MGKPVVITHEGQEIKLCGKSCKPKFVEEPAQYPQKLKKEGPRAVRTRDRFRRHGFAVNLFQEDR